MLIFFLLLWLSMYDSTANTRINKVKTSIVFMGITLAFVRLEGNHIRKSHPLSLSIVFQNCNIQVKAVQLENLTKEKMCFDVLYHR